MDRGEPPLGQGTRHSEPLQEHASRVCRLRSMQHRRRLGLMLPWLIGALFFVQGTRSALGEESVRDPEAWLRSVRSQVFQEAAPNRNGSVRMECQIEELDKEGQVKKKLILHHRRIYQDGTLREELLSASEDGQDVTARQRREEAGMDRRESSERWSLDNALAPAIPPLTAPDRTYQMTFEKESLEGRWRLTYRPREAKPTSRVARGYVVVDDKDQLPLRLRFEPMPLPAYLDRLVTEVRYRRIGGVVVPESTDTRAEGGFLFIRKRYNIRMRYLDWSLLPIKAEAVSP